MRPRDTPPGCRGTCCGTTRCDAFYPTPEGPPSPHAENLRAQLRPAARRGEDTGARRTGAQRLRGWRSEGGDGREGVEGEGAALRRALARAANVAGHSRRLPASTASTARPTSAAGTTGVAPVPTGATAHPLFPSPLRTPASKVSEASKTTVASAVVAGHQ